MQGKVKNGWAVKELRFENVREVALGDGSGRHCLDRASLVVVVESPSGEEIFEMLDLTASQEP